MEELKSSDFTVINLLVTSDVKLETLIDSHHFSTKNYCMGEKICLQLSKQQVKEVWKLNCGGNCGC